MGKRKSVPEICLQLVPACRRKVLGPCTAAVDTAPKAEIATWESDSRDDRDLIALAVPTEPALG